MPASPVVTAPVNLTPTELSERWGGFSTGTLCNYRSQGKGPAFIRIGRCILYPLDAVEEYERSNRHGGASQ